MAEKPAKKKSETTKATAKTAKAPAKEAKEVKTAKAAASDVAPKKKVAKAPKVAAHSPGKPCKIANCKREYRAKGYCKAHYKKWRQGEYGLARYKTCKDQSECRQPMAQNRHGYCEAHFQNYYVKGVEVVHAPAAEKPKKEEKVAAAAS